MAEAEAAIAAVRADYDRHSRAARAIAAEYFGSGPVLGALMSATGL
jgi:hypothetical protein